MKTHYYLRMGSAALEQAIRFATKGSAIDAYRSTALELSRYDQSIDGCIHKAESRDTLSEYPDFVLSLGPRGGIQCTAA